VEDRCWDVDPTGKFTVALIDGTVVEATISYEKARSRYRIESTGLSRSRSKLRLPDAAER
jgi:hypothetical protein